MAIVQQSFHEINLGQRLKGVHRQLQIAKICNIHRALWGCHLANYKTHIDHGIIKACVSHKKTAGDLILLNYKL